MDSLERLQGLYADLQAFTETRLANIERLWHELEDSIQDFKHLLDKSPPPSTAEREAYNAGKIVLDEQEYGINDEFRHLSRAIGTALELEEVEAGQLLIQGSNGQPSNQEAMVVDVIGRFHDRRDLILQSFRITLEESLNLDRDDEIRLFFRDVVVQALDTKTGPPSNGSAFASKCLKSMEDLENRLAKVNEQIQSKQLLSQMRGPEFYLTLEFQKASLFKQHEALAAVLALLFRGNYVMPEDLHKLYAVVKRWHRLDILWVQYLPVFSAAFRQYASPEGSISADEAKRLDHLLFSSQSDSTNSPVRPLLAVLDLWWAAEFSGWFREPSSQDRDGEKRSQLVKSALKDHALEFLLSVCTSVNHETWRHSTRQELVALLVGDQGSTFVESDQPTSTYFHAMLMEAIEAFSEAWITNMPDDIRQLKNDEDDQRLLQITATQDGMVNATQREIVGRLHLESFLVLIAFAFEGRSEAAEQFWSDQDGNLYGFLTWASKRQTVPRVSAFCEMLFAISEGSENASAAHKFLLDDSLIVTTGRTRRVPTMNYRQIFSEIELYARKVHERKPIPQLQNISKISPPDLNEVESPIMLSCYLRLLTHLCRHYQPTRQYVLSGAGIDLPSTLLMLASGPVPTYLRATVFRMLEALVTDKDSAISNKIWQALDDWASGGHDIHASTKSTQPPERSLKALQATLSSVATSYDQYDAFVDLLRALVAPFPTTVIDGHPLTFSSDLGSSYRRPGIVPYVDFVCGQIFVRRVRELGDPSQALLCSYHCLDFMAASLESFNENYITMLDKGVKQQEGAGASTQDLVYLQCHPFARIMQWIFGVDMNKALLQVLHGKLEEVHAALPDAPIILTLLRCLDIFNMVLDLQPTYFDVVKPILKDTDYMKGIYSAGFASFEESVLAHSEIILDLCHYVSSSHVQLSIRGLAVLQKLVGSRKLHNSFAASGPGKTRNLIDMLGPNVESALLPVADAMAARFQVDVRELEDGFEASGYVMKDSVLAFLNACLSIQTEIPSIAHLLLGFGKVGDRLAITSSMEDGVSLFNAIVGLVVEYPDGRDGETVSWLIHLKSAAMRALQHLWTASISSDIVLGQLRRLDFLAAQFLSQATVSQGTIWDGNSISDPAFWYTTSAEALTEFLSLRACLYDYTAREIGSISNEQLLSLQRQTISTLQGKTTDQGGIAQSHLTLFDLFDFADLDIMTNLSMPDTQYFADLDVEIYKLESSEDTPELYNIGMVAALLHMRQGQMLDQQAQNPNEKLVDQDALGLEVDFIVARLEARNRWTLVQKARTEALHNYVDMAIAAVHSIAIEAGNKTQFILRILQIILPKLDTYVADEAPEAIELARAADALLLALAQKSSPATNARVDEIVADRLFQLFRICVDGIPLASTSLELRTVLYSICSQYLSLITSSETTENDPYRKARGNGMDCVRSASQRLISIVSDDAEDGSDTCRLNALTLLSMLTLLARSQKSNVVIDGFIKANVIEILLEPIRNVAADFDSTSVKQRPFLLKIFESRAFLLVQISRTRAGASALLDAGLIQTLRDSNIFRADPDLGMDLDTSLPTTNNNTISTIPSALLNYFILLSSTLRILLSAFLSRGYDNEQMQYLVRTFLADHRPNMVGVFKKAAGVNGKVGVGKLKEVIEECVRCYTGLAVGTGFCDSEDEAAMEGFKAGNNGFT